MFFIAYTFIEHVHVFAGGVKVVSHLSCWISAIFKYFCPLSSEKEMQFYMNIVTCDPSSYTMDHTKFIVTD